MTFIWLLVWLFHSTPALHMWNNWAVALAICLVLDILGSNRVGFID